MNQTAGERVLMLSHEGRSIDFTTVYRSLDAHEHVDVHLLTRRQLKHLGKALRSIDTRGYRYVIVDLPFNKLHRATRALRRLPGLVIYEEDACQNFIPASRWYGKFADAYRRLPGAHLVLTGYNTARGFGELGFNAHFLAKGFNPASVYPTDTARDIPAAFIGRVRSRVYAERAALLDHLGEQRNVQLLRTDTLDEYRERLNRIQVFVSADIGLGEYMAKNFEAMACGCAVLAYRQGDGEEEALGLKDGENIALYGSAEEALEKLDWLQRDADARQCIAETGRQLAEAGFRHDSMANRLLDIVEGLPPGSPDRTGIWAAMKKRLARVSE